MHTPAPDIVPRFAKQRLTAGFIIVFMKFSGERCLHNSWKIFGQAELGSSAAHDKIFLQKPLEFAILLQPQIKIQGFAVDSLPWAPPKKTRRVRRCQGTPWWHQGPGVVMHFPRYYIYNSKISCKNQRPHHLRCPNETACCFKGPAPVRPSWRSVSITCGTGGPTK